MMQRSRKKVTQKIGDPQEVREVDVTDTADRERNVENYQEMDYETETNVQEKEKDRYSIGIEKGMLNKKRLEKQWRIG